MGVVAAAADQGFLCDELVGALFVEKIDDALHLAHYFGADAVAGEQKKIVGRHTQCLAGKSLRGLLEPHRRLGNWAVPPDTSETPIEGRPCRNSDREW